MVVLKQQVRSHMSAMAITAGISHCPQWSSLLNVRGNAIGHEYLEARILMTILEVGYRRMNLKLWRKITNLLPVKYLSVRTE